MSRANLVALLLAGGLLLSSAQVRAEDPSLVILLRPPGADRVVLEATTRLEAELRAAGFTVRVVEGTTGADGRAQVEGTRGAPRAGSFATIALIATNRGAAADVWVADHITRKTLVRRLDVGDPGVENAASDLAIRSVELLRASLLEVSAPQKKALPADLARWLRDPAPPGTPLQPPSLVAPPTPAPPTWARGAPPSSAPGAPAASAPVAPSSSDPVTPPPSAPAAPSATTSASGSARPSASVEVGVALLASPSFGAAAAPALRIAAVLPLHLGLRATLVPEARTELTATEGTVALRQQVVTIEVTYTFGLERRRVFPVLALGGGIYHLRVDGTAKTPYIGEHHDLVAGIVSVGAGLGVRVVDGVTLLVDGSALVVQPEPAVTIVGKVAGTTGRPAFLGGAGVVLGF